MSASHAGAAPGVDTHTHTNVNFGSHRCNARVWHTHTHTRELWLTQVQRPGVAQAISMDVFILRWAAAIIRRVRKLNTDLPALVDEWASSLFR